MTHVYTGRTTRWGLRSGARCRVVGAATGGGRRIKAEGDETVFVVGRNQVRPMTEEEKQRERRR